MERSLKFYRDGLGFPTDGIVGEEFEHGAVAFFELIGGMKLAIWKREDIAHEANVVQTTANPTEFTLGHNVNSREEVDMVLKKAEEAGATIVDPAHETFWGGYSGHFQDPDGHLWEVVYNPAWKIDD